MGRRLLRLPAVARSALALVHRSSPGLFVACVGSQVLAGLAVTAQVVLGRSVVNGLGTVAGTGRAGDVLGPSAAALGVTAVVLLLDQWRTDQQRVLGEATAAAASDDLLRAVTAVPLVRFDDPAFHDRMLRAQMDVVARPVQLAFALLTLVSSGVATVGVLGVVAAISPAFVVLVLLAAVPCVLGTIVAARWMHGFERAQTPSDRRRQYFFFLLAGRDAAAEVRAFGLGPQFRRRHRTLHDGRVAGLRRLAGRRLVVLAVGIIATAALLGLAVAGLAQRVASGAVSPAAAVAAVGGLLLLSTRIQPMASAVGSLIESALFLDDLAWLSLVSVDDTLPIVRPRRTVPGRVHIEGVSFRYPARSIDALHDVDLTIEPNEVVALVGENGSGKSTLVKLLAGLYEPARGRVLWDGIDRAALGASWRDLVAPVFQEQVRYNLTVAEVLGLGRIDQEVDVDAMAAAALAAGATSVIEGLDAGLDSILGPQFTGGTDISGGQWQRLALARALYRDAPLVVLDEPTAALDPEAEAAWFTSLRTLLQGRSALVVSHRFSTVRSADRIFVLERGSVVEQGTHEQLLGEGGRYARMFDLQAAGYRP